LIKNRLTFSKVDEEMTFLDKPITVLYLELYYESLNAGLINKYLFKQIKELKITHCLDQIEQGIFEELNHLKLIVFNIDNLKDFLHQKENTWLAELNSKIEINLENYDEVQQHLPEVINVRFLYPKASFNIIYDFPNEDICLFKDLSHNRLINVEVQSNIKIRCSCTIIWLSIYQHMFLTSKNDNLTVVKDCNNSTLKKMSCNFSKLFQICNTGYQPDLFFNNDIDILYFFKWVQLVLVAIFQPILGFIGLINNFVIIIVVRNKAKRKEFKETMYFYVLMNAIFNILYCLIVVVNIFSTCLFFNSSTFCSSIYIEKTTQYFKIIFVNYLGSVLKLCSNLTYLLFSFTRFTLVSKIQDKKTTTKCLINKKSVLSLVTILILSSLLNIFKLFQYSVNNEMEVGRDFPFETRDHIFCKKIDNLLQCRLFDIFKISHKFVNDILFILIMLFIDLLLIRKLNKHLKNQSPETIDSEHHKKIEKSRKKLKHLIKLNLIVYFFSNMPEFMTTILLILFSDRMNLFCQDKLSCDLINEEAQVFTLISILAQFYIFFKFDKNFNTSLKDLAARFLFKFSCVQKLCLK
jgi:hypothetical protein